MCMVSAIHNYGQGIPDYQWTRPLFDEFQKAVRQAQEFDEKTNQPHCEDPMKVEFMKKVLERLDAIEKKLS